MPSHRDRPVRQYLLPAWHRWGYLAGECQADAIYKFGENIGLAFQLQDDYLDVYGDAKTFGKKIGGDILNNKKTFMLISALALAEGETKKRLLALLDAEANDDKIEQVTAIYGELGIDKMAREKIAEYSQKAMDYIDELPNNAELKNFANSLTERKL